MTSERAAITAALNQADIDNVLYNKDEIPKSLPAAIVTLESEVGKNSTSRRFTDTDLGWSVFLIVNAQNAIDPDADLYTLKESFRDKYIRSLGKDFPEVEYYTARIDGARLVRIARINLQKSGIGASS